MYRIIAHNKSDNSDRKENPMEAISLKAARINADLTQEQVKERTGFARSTLINWESGKTSPRYADLLTLCELYGIPVECVKVK